MQRLFEGVPAGGLDDVLDLDAPGRLVQTDTPPVPGRWLERRVAVVLRRPGLHICRLVELHLDSGRPGVAEPQERSARDGLVRGCELDGVVGESRSEVAPELGFSVVAVGARVHQDPGAAEAQLDGQGVSVSVTRDGEETMGTTVAPAPDLRLSQRGAAKQRQTGV